MTTIHRNDKNFQQIRELLSSRPRPVETGCVVKISLAKLFGRSYVNPTSTSIYGIVGKRLDYCHFTTAVSYDIKILHTRHRNTVRHVTDTTSSNCRKRYDNRQISRAKCVDR